MPLARRSALNTGSRGGIGFATARVRAAQGCGITCNAVCPGTVLTQAIRQPSGKFVMDDNVAFRCDPRTDSINAAALRIDGAWTAGRA